MLSAALLVSKCLIFIFANNGFYRQGSGSLWKLPTLRAEQTVLLSPLPQPSVLSNMLLSPDLFSF